MYLCIQTIKDLKVCSVTKNQSTTHNEDMSSMPDFIHRRWKQNVQTSRLLSRQLGLLSVRVKQKRSKTIDAKASQVESDMQWKRTPGTIKGINNQWKDRMDVALNAARDTGLDIPQSRFGEYQAMVRHTIELDASFVCHQTFYRWINGKRKTVVTKNMTLVVDSMFKKYAKNK